MNHSQLTVHHSNFFPSSDNSHRALNSSGSCNSQSSSHNSQSPSRNSQIAAQASPLNQLREQIRAVETENRRTDGTIIKHGCEALDRLLPDGGYSRGTLTQWISAGGQGAEYLSLRVAQQACQSGGALVIVDPHKQFFPPAAAVLGIDLNHLIVLQTPHEKDLLWGVDQALRCPAVGAVWGWLEVIEQRQFRRFQLSAETSGAIGLFLQPYAAVRQPSWAEVQWLVGLGASPSLSTLSQEATLDSQSFSQKFPGLKSIQPLSGETGLRNVSLQLTRCRGTHTGKSIRLTIDPVTGVIEPASRRLEMTAGVRPANSRKRI